MKKFLASFIFVVVFAGYAVYQYLGNSSVVYTAQNIPNPSAPSVQIADNGNVAQAPPLPNPTPVQTEPVPTPTPTPTPTPVPPPTPQPQGQYIDGTYTGDTANAYYGYIQVQVTVAGGKITDVQFLQYPNDRSTSRYINSQAMPILTTEAIQAQSAQVDGVSGASDSSGAFRESLSSALAQAQS